MIGIIGGTGLYQMNGLQEVKRHAVETPFGSPSAPIVTGKLGGNEVAFLPRHGENHELLPSEINYRANLFALKSLGVTQILSVSATGSLCHEIAPGDLAMPSQYLDLTKGKRAHTFFGEGLAAHVSTAHPTCPSLSTQVSTTAQKMDHTIHTGKTYACVEGPRLGTQAESHFLRKLDAHLVGMTNVPEVFLAREAQICYCTIAVATDYDCWLDDPSQHATVDKVMALYQNNISRVREILAQVISSEVSSSHECDCRKSLKYALMTRREKLPAQKKALLDVLEL